MLNRLKRWAAALKRDVKEIYLASRDLRVHRGPLQRDRSTGPARPGLRATDERARHRPDHFKRNGGRDWHRRSIFRKAATSAPGSDWCQNRCRLATERSSATYRGAAI